VADNDKVWQELYSYEAEIFAFIKNAVGDADIAKDLFQDIYLSALKNLSSLDPQRSLKNWLFTTTRNRVINYFRFNSKREFSEIKEDSLQTRIKHSDDAEMISQVLNQLPPRQKMVLLLREVDGFSYQEISQQLNSSVSAITALLSRARENFQKYYVSRLLPDWFIEIEGLVELTDIFRFINPFNPPLDIINLIDARRTKYFASKTSGWDNIRDRFFNSSDLDHILSRLELKDGQKAADLGCGSGFVSLPLAILGQKVVALDADPGMIVELNRTRSEIELKKLHPALADLRQLPFRTDCFDNIFLVLVLHHIPNPFLVIEQCANILKESGRIIIVDLIKHRRLDLADQMHDLWLGFNPDSLARRIKQSGLDLVDSGVFNNEKKLASFFQIWTKE
jgi:RNA polymerase sigma factor (sigma-70 family)